MGAAEKKCDTTCKPCCKKFVQIFRSHRKFNRFVLNAHDHGYSTSRVEVDWRGLRPIIRATFVCTHDIEEGVGTCCCYSDC